jgi:hypothetical protein
MAYGITVLCVSVSALYANECLNQSLQNPVCIIVSDPIPTEYFINSSHQPLPLYMNLCSGARLVVRCSSQNLGKSLDFGAGWTVQSFYTKVNVVQCIELLLGNVARLHPLYSDLNEVK